MVRVAVVGLGKMGLSHLSILHAHPDVELVGVCDKSSYVLGVLNKYTGVQIFSDYEEMLKQPALDAVLIATPSRSHAAMVRSALQRGLHVFCEKPFCLDPADSAELTSLSEVHGLVSQVGYHYRFVGAFQEVKRLLDAEAIGDVTHVLGEAYGPVVLKPSGGTWRSQRAEGGGSLYDYAAHPLDLMTWYFGEAEGVGGTVLNPVFSRDIDDEVCSTLYYPGGRTGQVSVNWSDESQRKMTTAVTIWGTTGRIHADRQECQVFLRDSSVVPDGYNFGWNVRYATDLTKPVRFYLRGEEYSAQIDQFVQRVKDHQIDGLNTFRSASATDRTIALLVGDARKGPATTRATGVARPEVSPRPWPAVRAAVRELAAAAAVAAARLNRRVLNIRKRRT